MSERLTKKQLKRDRFIDSIYAAWAYAQDNIPIVALGLVGLVAVVALGVRIGGSSVEGGGGNPEAERALSSARSQLSLGRPETAEMQLEAVRTEHRRSRAAREATFLLGLSLHQRGEYTAARDAWEDFLDRPVYPDYLEDAARLGMAACLEDSGDLAGAQSEYGAVWEKATQPGSRIQGAFGAARCARAQGLTDEARSHYQALVDEFPDAPETEDAQFQLLLLSAS